MSSHAPEPSERQNWMGLLARAEAAHLATLLPDPLPDHSMLRAPEKADEYAKMLAMSGGGAGSMFISAMNDAER